VRRHLPDRLGVTKVRWNVTRLAVRRLDLVHHAGEHLLAGRDQHHLSAVLRRLARDQQSIAQRRSGHDNHLLIDRFKRQRQGSRCHLLALKQT